MVLISRRNRSTALGLPVMSMSASDPVKISAVRAWVVAVGGDDSGVLKVAQALAEGLGGDPAEAVHQVGEPFGAGEKVADHQQAPSVADAFQRACDLAEVLVGANVPGHVLHNTS